MRILILFVALAQLSASPGFLILRDDLLLTSFAVSCPQEDGKWRTHWKIVGESESGSIDLGVIPEGMKAQIGLVPVESMGWICRAEAEGHKKGSRRIVKLKTLWLLDDNVESCSTERACARIVISRIT